MCLPGHISAGLTKGCLTSQLQTLIASLFHKCARKKKRIVGTQNDDNNNFSTKKKKKKMHCI